ncbi:hypothetical protein DXD68_16865 [Parabacteroides sp. TM07-1AC]|uniref:ArnT family glycosyltransferase n=1 Tax=Parabacteroides sp. TM07-1AC TaxID=2292363 RepID=UPI000F00FF6C|nr:hypothetical protein [Parabacteroides sp. TM07-1AC]RHU24784.1 hypothetical protein DXD68_16865 [Parabacteroides sp. TM07-1AC]
MAKYVALVLFLVLKFFTLDNCFFWDNVAGYSMPASYLLEHGLFSFVYPVNYVSEPPLAHMYLAVLWTLLGKNLLVAHLSVTLFSVGVIWQVWRLCEKLNTKYTPYIFLLAVLEPTLSTQLILISPDVILCFFALLSINLLLENKRGWLAVSACCLGLVSIRGFVVCAGLGLGYLVIAKVIEKKSFKEAFVYVFPSFIPVLLALGAWFLYRKLETGYFLYQPGFEYQEHRELASLSHIIKNIASLAIRMLDSGRIIVWLFLLVAIIKMGIKNFIAFVVHSRLSIIYLSVLFTLFLVTIPVTNPFGDRYFIVLYILLALITAQLLSKVYEARKIRIVFVGMLLVLVSGNFWVYSEKMSKAWDSVLCHLPCYSLRQEMITYLEDQHIDVNDVSASFPLNAPFADLDINEDKRQFTPVDWDKSRYIIYSNLYNWDDESINAIHSKWKLQKELKSGLIFLRLYVPLDEK